MKFYCPCSGTVLKIVEDSKTTQIQIFLSLFDPHTQYIPLRSKVITINHYAGGNLPAFLEGAVNNERVETILKSDELTYTIDQMTGLIARRIKVYVEKGKTYDIGEKLGHIFLGSRVDITLPKKNVKKMWIQEGDKVSPLQPILKLK